MGVKKFSSADTKNGSPIRRQFFWLLRERSAFSPHSSGSQRARARARATPRTATIHIRSPPPPPPATFERERASLMKAEGCAV